MTDGANATDKSILRTNHALQKSRLGAYAIALLSEPLIHFLLVGSLLFGIYAFVNRDTNPTPERIVVSAGKIEHLTSLFSRTWQRPPTPTELKGLVDDYVREEIAYREGMQLGLDQDDTIIRRRIRQKMDFIADDLAGEIEPTDQQLDSFIQENRDAYLVDTRLSFKQVFLDPESHQENLEESVAQLLNTLRSDPAAKAEELGDRTLLEHQFRDQTKRDIASVFGESFAVKVSEMPIQQWNGPIQSAYGVHLVFVEERTEGRLPTLEDVRPLVRRDWEQKRRAELAESFYQGLLQKYKVAIEWPDLAAEGS